MKINQTVANPLHRYSTVVEHYRTRLDLIFRALGDMAGASGLRDTTSASRALVFGDRAYGSRRRSIQLKTRPGYRKRVVRDSCLQAGDARFEILHVRSTSRRTCR
jgi:hypothetical protein